MPTANSIITPQTPKTATAVCTTANTTYTGSPTNTQTLLNAASAAVRITSITAIPRATVTATMLQLYLSKDNGTTKVLLDTALMSAHTVAATTAIPQTDFGYTEDAPLILQAGDVLYVAIGVTLADGIAFTVQYSDY